MSTTPSRPVDRNCQGGPSEPPTTPPRHDEIKAIIEQVLDRVDDQRIARQAAVCFVDETEKFIDNLGLADEQARTRQTIDPDLLKDMKNQIENSDAERGFGTLHHSIQDACSDPEMARWMLPQFAQGISTYLALRRLDLLNKEHDDGQPIQEMKISRTAVEQFRDLVLSTKNGLLAAIASMNSYATAIATKHHLHDTIKSGEAEDIVRKGMLGTTDPATLTDFAGSLQQWLNLLEDDLKNGVSTHFWHLKPGLAQTS